MWNFPLQPPMASNFAFENDLIFFALTALTLIFTLIVVVAVVIFTVRYRAGTKVDRSRPVYEDLRLELTWTIVPLLLGLVMFFFGAQLYVKMRTPPKDARELFVIGKQWMWQIQHPNGVRENNTLHVPVGKPIKLTMISQDVIHAFYIPAFRTQFYVTPGRYTQMWFTPTKVGQYHLFCNLYCGTQHSEMGGTVYVMEPRDYQRWLDNGGTNAPRLTMEQNGERLFGKLGCANCHGGRDTARAPTLVGIYNRNRRFSNAAGARADEDYLRESIIRPYDRLTAGYGQTMPAYEGQVTEEELMSLVRYLKAGRATGARPGNTEGGGEGGLAVGAVRAQSGAPTSTEAPARAPAVGALAAERQEQQ